MTEVGAGGLARLSSRQILWLGAIAALVAFLPSLADGFVFDDEPLIVTNPYAHELRHLGRCFTTDLWDTPNRPVDTASTKFYRPLVCASYVLNWQISGGAAWPFHAVNLLLHTLATVLAARLALRWTASPAAALLVALVLAVHPSRSENVIWVAGRTDLLMACFLLGAHEVAVLAARRLRAWGAWFVAGTLFTFALLSKEFAVAWPFLLGTEFVLASSDHPLRRRLGIAMAASGAAAALYLVVRALTFPIRPPELQGMELPLPLHAAYVLLSLGYYTERIVFPWPQTFHFRPVAIHDGRPELFLPSVLLGGVVVLAVGAWLVSAWRKDRAIAALVALGVVVLLPVLNVSYTGFPGTTADRFLYLPLLPLFVAAARHGRAAIERWARRRLAKVVILAVTLVYSAVNWVRALDYSSEEAIWRHELEVNPDNPQALASIGKALASIGDDEEAVRFIRRSLSPEALRYGLLAKPALYYFGLLELQGPRLADGNVTALATLLDEIVTIASGHAPRGRRRAGDVELAAPLFDEHFHIHAANAEAHLLASAAVLASRLGDDGRVFEFVTRIPPGAPLDAAWRYNLGLALGRSGHYGAAKNQLAIGTELDPSPSFRRAASALSGAITEVELLRGRAAREPEPAAALIRAKALALLGAYLRAAREYRDAQAVTPCSSWPRYVEALVSARLDAEAGAVARRCAPSPGDAARVLDTAKSGLSPRTARAIPARPGDEW